MKKTYSWTVNGEDVLTRKWVASGVLIMDISEFDQIFERVMGETFQQLTSGKAVYGKPGVFCKGPYTIVSIIISLDRNVTDEATRV